MNAAALGLMNQPTFYQATVSTTTNANTTAKGGNRRGGGANANTNQQATINLMQQQQQQQQNFQQSNNNANFTQQNPVSFMQFQAPLPPQQHQQQQSSASNNNNNNEMALNLTRQLMGGSDGLQQALPTATSTPNPIQMQTIQQQDLFANLFLKLDANSFFPKSKDQLQFILNQNTGATPNTAAVLVNSNGNVVPANTQQFAQMTTLNGQKLVVNQNMLNNQQQQQQQQQQFLMDHQMKQQLQNQQLQQQQLQHLQQQQQQQQQQQPQQFYLNPQQLHQQQLQQGQLYQHQINQLQK
jgi:hypothetical protein